MLLELTSGRIIASRRRKILVVLCVHMELCSEQTWDAASECNADSQYTWLKRQEVGILIQGYCQKQSVDFAIAIWALFRSTNLMGINDCIIL